MSSQVAIVAIFIECPSQRDFVKDQSVISVVNSDDEESSEDVTNHVLTFSVKVVRSLVEDDREARLLDNPNIRDIQRHLYDLIWQAVRDKVRDKIIYMELC